MTTWYERYPERLEAELRALTAAGFAAQVDSAARATGELCLAVKCPVDGTEHEFRVVFPVDYPFFAFQIFAPTLSLARHQDPYSKALCFRTHIETEWRSDDTVAKYLVERLPIILEANCSEGVFEGEGHEGAPVTGYLPFAPESVVLLGDSAVSAEQTQGTLLLGLEPECEPQVLLRAAVLEIRDQRGAQLAGLDAKVRALYPRTFRGRWVRLDARPRSVDVRAILADAIQRWPALAQLDVNAGAPDVLGIVFPDEARYREMHDAWIFLVRRKDRAIRHSKHKRLPPGNQISLYLARADRIGHIDLTARVPRLVPLAHRKATIFGLGALGSMVAWQLARAGIGRLALIDNDFVGGGTMPRWLLGLCAAGRQKVGILAGFMGRNYPRVAVEPISLRVGATGWNKVAPELMGKALAGSDVLVDCTAEFTVHHYLSTIAREKGLPYVWVSGTQGGWGGVVGRVVPGRTAGCWECFYRHRTDGTFPGPEQEEGPDIQPIGCFSPTFRGAGFDMDLVSIMCARMTVATLCRDRVDGYGDFNWDVGIVDLWKDGRPIAPMWQTFSLARHPDCGLHG